MNTPADPPLADLAPARGVFLVARREITTRVRSRSFVISTVLVLIGLLAIFLISSRNHTSTVKVGLAGQAAGLQNQLVTASAAAGTSIQASTVDTDDGERQVADGTLDALVSGPQSALRVTVKTDLSPTVENVLNSLMRRQVLDATLAEAKQAGAAIDPHQIESTVDSKRISLHALQPADPYRSARLAIAFIVTVLLFMSIQLFGQAVAQGVVEEKSSRVVEILLSTLRPWQLMTGKVIGVGIAGLLQIAIITVVALIGATVSGAVSLPPGSTMIILWSVVWYMLGFFLFSSLLAAAASLVSRQEEVPSAVTPVTILLLIPYIIGISQITNNPGSTLVEVLSLIPPFCPILMPARIALGTVAGWQIPFALALTLLALAGALWLGSRIYASAVLRTGSRVRLREALNIAVNAGK